MYHHYHKMGIRSWPAILRSYPYHEVSMARVKRLRRLCARVTARARERAGRCRHLERNTSIRLLAIFRKQKSLSRESQRTISQIESDGPMVQPKKMLRNWSASRSKFDVQQPIFFEFQSRCPYCIIITLYVPLKGRRALHQPCLLVQGLHSISSASNRPSSQPRIFP